MTEQERLPDALRETAIHMANKSVCAGVRAQLFACIWDMQKAKNAFTIFLAEETSKWRIKKLTDFIQSWKMKLFKWMIDYESLETLIMYLFGKMKYDLIKIIINDLWLSNNGFNQNFLEVLYKLHPELQNMEK